VPPQIRQASCVTDAYDQAHAFARLVLPPEEDRARLITAPWQGGYRWFRAPNVICLEKARRLKRKVA